ncbi:MAG: hypothetical protein LBP72_01885 [Dysgonamonadaceae bacterium]|nr:hypothetical protein [Dysgonamonadaceae bacterium]
MKQIIHKKMIQAGLFIILFLYPSLVQSFHISHEQLCASESANRPHNNNDCPVCLFHYVAFTGVETQDLTPFFPPLASEFSFYSTKEYRPFLYSYFLRGPPSGI